MAPRSTCLLLLLGTQVSGLRRPLSIPRTRLMRRAATVNPSLQQIQTDEAWDVEAWRKGYSNCEKEDIYSLDASTLPADLEGTFFRNGGAKYVVGEEKVLHPFDGDGMIAAITVKDGGAFYRNKFVRTPGYKKELRENKICYRGTFGTKKKGWNLLDLRVKNLANTHVLFWADRFFALWEGGKPFKVDPASLSTFGESQLGGALRPKDNFAAHYKIDPKRERLCNFCAVPDPPSGGSTITTFEFDKDFNMVYRRDVQIPAFAVTHDTAITDNYFVFAVAPVKFDPVPFVLGQKSAAQCIEYDGDNSPSQFILVPRDPEKEETIIEAPAHFNFHNANAFEDADGNVVLDQVNTPYMILTDSSSGEEPIWNTVDWEADVPATQLERWTLDPRTKTVVSRGRITSEQPEFPTVAPVAVGQPYKYMYSGAARDSNVKGPVGAYIKVDMETQECQKWKAEPYEFVGEPVFAPRKLPDGSFATGEDDGYLLSYIFNGRDMQSDFVVFDAKDITKGPVSRIPLKDYIPHGLHGKFVPGLSFDEDKAKRASKLFIMAEKNKWNEVKSEFSGLGIGNLLNP